MKRLKEIIKLISIMQIIDVFLFPFIWIISLVYKPFFKDIWLIEENPNEACDNGYIFFKYLRKTRKDLNVYYVINKRSKDYDKVKSLGNIIYHKSLKHFIYYLNAKKIIVTQKYANPSPALFHILHKFNIIKTPRIFLGHGITKDDAKMFYYDRCKFRLFICGAEKEYEYVKNTFGYPKENVIYTGLARFDNLNLNNNINKFILVYPTWRNYINNQNDFDYFMGNYYNLLDNELLVNILEKNNIKLKLVLHKNMKKYDINYKTLSDNITINHNEDVNIQDLINRTDLLITDFSSLYFDIVYRKRPIIYYQFDYDKYRKNQLEEGYFSYEKDGFGDVFENSDLIVNKIKYYIDNNFKIEDEYSKRMDSFFARKDKENCKRILEEIEKL